MIIFAALKTIVFSIVIAYLNFTNGLALIVEDQLIPHSSEREAALPDTVPSTELTLLSRLFASTEGVSRILSENAAFQNAASGITGTASILRATSPKITEVEIEDALVNIFCEYKTQSYTRTTTGTGFFIHDQGVILTNAHVAQFLLLETGDGGVTDTECVVRAGNPALPRYRAELLFISPTWVFNNAKLITAEHPRGTGEYDYALLYIAESIDDTPLPSSFPRLPLYTDFLSKNLTGMSVITAGYPAEKLSREGPRAALLPAIASTSIRELYTFGTNYADIFSITESPVGEQGASGGPIIRDSHGVIGLIATKGDPVTDGERSLRALTLSYIDRTIREETGFSLIENAGGNVAYRGGIFKEVLSPFLTHMLSDTLDE